MASKSKKSSTITGSKRSIQDVNVLPKKKESTINEKNTTLGTINEGEFSIAFRRFCLECDETVVPNVRTIYKEDAPNKRSSVNSTNNTYVNGSSENMGYQSTNISFPEVLVLEDEATGTISKIKFKNMHVSKNMLLALTKTFAAVECTVKILM